MNDTHEDRKDPQVYELGYHLVPTLSEDELALRVGELQKLIADGEGSIITEEFPSLVDLAYPMRRMNAGKWETFETAYFGWMKFDMTPAEAHDLKEKVAQHEAMLRFILIKTVRESTMSPRIAPVRKEIAAGEETQGGEGEAPAEVSEAQLEKSLEGLVGEDAEK